MNGVPMKFDYSKTINEQLDTFNYYKDRYASYELELIKDRQQITQLTNNWNELEEWLAREYIKTGYEEYYRLALKDLYDKMKEIEKGHNEDG